MPPETVDASAFSPDVQDLLYQCHCQSVRFLIVGGEAVIFYGHIRLTGDIDVFYDRETGNATRLYGALQTFWKGIIPGLGDSSALEEKGRIFQFGIPPNRVDLLNDIDGVDFKTAWETRTDVLLTGATTDFALSYIGLDELIINKRASGRPKDLEDIPFLLEAQQTNEYR